MQIYENIRSIILTLLIGISLILTGSLWFDNYHGLFSVMSNMVSFFSKEIDLEDKSYIREYVKPYKTTIANGDKGKWVYYVSSDATQDAFELIKNVLLNIDDISIEIAYNNEWEELTNRRSIICEFAGAIDSKIFSLALNNRFNDLMVDGVGISAIALTKTTTGGNIYIKSEDDIYRIMIDNIDDFEHILSDYSNSNTYSKFVKLDEIGIANFNTRKISYKYDVLFPVSPKSANRHLVSKLIETKVIDTVEKLEEKVGKIFNRNDYIKFITDDNGYIYINDDQTLIRFYDNIIEYSTDDVGEAENEATWVSSFNTALRFIDSISELKNLYLVSANNTDEVYEFVFGAYIDELPIVNSNKVIADDRNAKIHIKVFDNKVIYYIENLTYYSAGLLHETYLSRFTHNILDDVLADVPKNSEVKILDIELVYDVASSYKLPVWITEFQSKEINDFVITEAGKLRNY